MTWTWIQDEVALAAHDALIAEFGGLAGVRDKGGLQSALGRPLNLAAYGSPGAADLAAAYAYGIVRNHPFADGNKRTGFSLALVFLLDNGFDFTGSDIETIEMVLELAAGRVTEDALAAWFRARLTPLG
jgi:death-on-curing protein